MSARGSTALTRRAARMARLCLLSVLLGSVALITSGPSRAESPVVPADLQAELLGKLAAYDRSFSARAGAVALVLVVTRSGNARSTLNAAVMKSELGKLERIGGVPHKELVIPFESPAALAKRCSAERAAIVYVTSGLEEQSQAIASALSGVDVLSVAAGPSAVPEGIVLGFELVSGKPKILLNLTHAKRQNVSFKADVLKLMKVHR